MEKYLITGAGGFVGRHLTAFLMSLEEQVDILGLDRQFDGVPVRGSCRWESMDLSDRQAFEKIVVGFKPRYIIHLAAGSSVAESWRDPASSILNNVTILLNLYESARLLVHAGTPCRILSIGSSEVYGHATADQMPFREESVLHADNPYAVSRLTQEYLSELYAAKFGLDIVSTRSFLHIGPGQSERFAVASFVGQLLTAKQSGRETAAMKTGNIDVRRDISDVRDVVRAYHLLLRHGRSGEVYNVCRGEAFSLREIIESAAKLLNLDVKIEIDPARLRPDDAEIVVGCNEKIRRETGWTPEIPLNQTLQAMLKPEYEA